MLVLIFGHCFLPRVLLPESTKLAFLDFLQDTVPARRHVAVAHHTDREVGRFLGILQAELSLGYWLNPSIVFLILLCDAYMIAKGEVCYKGQLALKYPLSYEGSRLRLTVIGVVLRKVITDRFGLIPRTPRKRRLRLVAYVFKLESPHPFGRRLGLLIRHDFHCPSPLREG